VLRKPQSTSHQIKPDLAIVQAKERRGHPRCGAVRFSGNQPPDGYQGGSDFSRFSLSLETHGLAAALGHVVHSHRRVVRGCGVRLENLPNTASVSNVAFDKDI
jgi:hypothetical protein